MQPPLLKGATSSDGHMAQVTKQQVEHPEIKELAAAFIRAQGQESNEFKILKKRLSGTD